MSVLRAAIDSEVFDLHCICRQVGSTGLVIFERDDILLRHRLQLEDQTLGDIDADFVAMLQDIRNLEVRFGFISRHPAALYESLVRIDSATLTRLLDDLLKVSGALPDFWIEAAFKPDLEKRRHARGRPELDLILKLTESYKADLKGTVIVRKAEAARVSRDTLGLTEIYYPGVSAPAALNVSRPATVAWLKTRIKHALGLE